METENGLEYLYTPHGFQRLFSFSRSSQFRLQFTQGKVTKILIHFPNCNYPNPQEYNWNKNNVRKAFNFFFYYQPPTWVELSRQFGGETLYTYEYCLGEKAATHFPQNAYEQWTDQVELYYDQHCEAY